MHRDGGGSAEVNGPRRTKLRDIKNNLTLSLRLVTQPRPLLPEKQHATTRKCVRLKGNRAQDVVDSDDWKPLLSGPFAEADR